MNDLIQIIKVLSDEDLKIINKHIDETCEFKKATVFSGNIKNKAKVDTTIRSSVSTSLVDGDEATNLLHDRINSALVDYKFKVSKLCQNFTYYPVPGGRGTKSWRESIQILEYSGGQEYKFHHDAAQRPQLPEYERKISVIVYLSNGFEGGGTEFPHATFKPKAGYGLIFPSNWCYPHSGQSVTKGKKRVAVTWYYVTLS